MHLKRLYMLEPIHQILVLKIKETIIININYLMFKII